MLPHPVDAFGCFVPEISGVEVAAEKQKKLDVRAILGAKLMRLLRLFLTPLVGIGKVSGGLCLDDQRQAAGICLSRHDQPVNRNVNVLRLA